MIDFEAIEEVLGEADKEPYLVISAADPSEYTGFIMSNDEILSEAVGASVQQVLVRLGWSCRAVVGEA